MSYDIEELATCHSASKKEAMKTAYTWERFLEVRKNHEFSPAYDSALENADLTSVELGFERHSDEWLQYFFDSYNPDDYPESYEHTSSKKETMETMKITPGELLYIKAQRKKTATASMPSDGDWFFDTNYASAYNEGAFFSVERDTSGDPHTWFWKVVADVATGPEIVLDSGEVQGDSSQDAVAAMEQAIGSYSYDTSPYRVSGKKMNSIKAQRKKTANVPDLKWSLETPTMAILYVNGSPDYIVDKNEVGGWWFIVTPDGESVENIESKEYAMDDAVTMAYVRANKTSQITEAEMKFIQARRKKTADLTPVEDVKVGDNLAEAGSVVTSVDRDGDLVTIMCENGFVGVYDAGNEKVKVSNRKETMKITEDEYRWVMAQRKKAAGSWSEPGDPGMGYTWSLEEDNIVGDGYLLSINGDLLKPFAIYGPKRDGGYYAFAEDGKGNDIGGSTQTFSDARDAIEWCQNAIKNYILN